MNRGGRPQHVVWQHYDKIEKDGNIYAKCINCGVIRSNHVDRLKIHTAQCTGKCNVAEPIPSAQEEITTEFNESTTSQPAISLKSTEPEVLTTKKQKIDGFITKTNPAAAKKIDLLVAKFFYSNNIPFSIVEHSTFQELLSALRPGYRAPSRKALAGSLLDAVTLEVEQIAKENLSGKAVTLIEDGWSNIHNDPVIATCLHSEGKSYFLEAVECGAVSKNADFHKQIIDNAIHMAQDKYSCKVKAIVTDNAKVMEKARQLLCNQTDHDQDLVAYGCSSHLLNLLGHDLTPDTILKQVVKIQKYFRNHHLPSAWLQECTESVKPQLPGDTRWNSQFTCLETFLHNRPLFQKIVEDHEDDIDKGIVLLINNYNLYKQCKDLLLQLKPVSVALDTLQKDTATIADACYVWLSLLKESSLQPHIEKVQDRINQILKPFHYLALILHPKYKGEGLTDVQSDSARTWATEKINGCLSVLIAYEAEELPFPPPYFSAAGRMTNPVIWWKGISKCSGFKTGPASKLAELAVLLLSSPASSAAIERVFSNFGFVHSKLRNRLGVDKCAKLVMCYRMLRGKNEPDY